MTKKQQFKVALLCWVAFGLILLFMFLACAPVDEIPAAKIPTAMDSGRPSFID